MTCWSMLGFFLSILWLTVVSRAEFNMYIIEIEPAFWVQVGPDTWGCNLVSGPTRTQNKGSFLIMHILSRAREVGSPANPLSIGADCTQKNKWNQNRLTVRKMGAVFQNGAPREPFQLPFFLSVDKPTLAFPSRRYSLLCANQVDAPNEDRVGLARHNIIIL